ncbi:chymotrypsin-2-like [Leptopilina heterotoma]|uniref:chymotrypsin-2-like n=1 Tax=Leptopilina heterotoma TaxID=63436 RepID=UPI001CA83CE6|nr:chymotrypsin-2-like [Leptopilina heterotoma]
MSRLLVSTFVLLALFGSSLGLSGGVKASRGQFPYHVSIQTADEFGNYCGGSILNSKWILTAATCIISPNTTLYYIMAGTTDWTNLDKSGTIFNVSEVVVHPENANNRAIDLALIKVKQEIKFTDTIKSVDLPYRDLTSQYLPVKITAWGAASSNTVETSIRDLHYFTSRIVAQDRCLQKYTWLKETEMCLISRRNYGICFKDVGSPVVIHDKYQVAIATNRVTCGSGDPDQVIRIWNYVDWIKSVIKNII